MLEQSVYMSIDQRKAHHIPLVVIRALAAAGNIVLGRGGTLGDVVLVRLVAGAGNIILTRGHAASGVVLIDCRTAARGIVAGRSCAILAKP